MIISGMRCQYLRERERSYQNKKSFTGGILEIFTGHGPLWRLNIGNELFLKVFIIWSSQQNTSGLLLLIIVGSDIFLEGFPLSIEVSVLIDCGLGPAVGRRLSLETVPGGQMGGERGDTNTQKLSTWGNSAPLSLGSSVIFYLELNKQLSKSRAVTFKPERRSLKFKVYGDPLKET